MVDGSTSLRGEPVFGGFQCRPFRKQPAAVYILPKLLYLPPGVLNKLHLNPPGVFEAQIKDTLILFGREQLQFQYEAWRF